MRLLVIAVIAFVLTIPCTAAACPLGRVAKAVVKVAAKAPRAALRAAGKLPRALSRNR